MLLILLVVALALAALLAFAAMRAPTFRIERAARIEAPPERIAPLIADFRRWTDWSPWEQLDPDLRRTYSGATSGAGAVYEWSGNGKAGAGRMAIRSATASRIDIQLDFLKPFVAHNTAEFKLTPAGTGTDVDWAMSGPRPFMIKLIGLFCDMDKMVGKDFEAGLAAMKREAKRAVQVQATEFKHVSRIDAAP